MGRIVQAIELPTGWIDLVLARLALRDEVARIRDERGRLADRLRRLGRAYVDGLVSDGDYASQKRFLELELASLVVPEVDSAEEAGRLIRNLPELWDRASLPERHELVATVLDAVYVDPKVEKAVVAIRPKAAFRAIFEVATAKAGSGVELLKAQPQPAVPTGSGEERCLWWRRGRVELPVQ